MIIALHCDHLRSLKEINKCTKFFFFLRVLHVFFYFIVSTLQHTAGIPLHCSIVITIYLLCCGEHFAGRFQLVPAPQFFWVITFNLLWNISVLMKFWWKDVSTPVHRDRGLMLQPSHLQDLMPSEHTVYGRVSAFRDCAKEH